MSRSVPARSESQAAAFPLSTKVLIVGRGVLRLGNYMATFFSDRVDEDDCLLGFDHENLACVYRLRLKGITNVSSDSGRNLLIGLDNSVADYYRALGANGILLLDTSRMTMLSERSDLETFPVPSSVLAKAAMRDSSKSHPKPINEATVAAVMLGSALAVEDEHLEGNQLYRVFSRFHSQGIQSLVLATCEGYDWIQDRQLRAKSRSPEVLS